MVTTIDKVRQAACLLNEVAAELGTRQSREANHGSDSLDLLASRIVTALRVSYDPYPDDETEIRRIYDAGAENWHAARVQWVRNLLAELRDAIRAEAGAARRRAIED